jgi:hypothetical protein
MYAGMIAKMARMALFAPRRFFLAQTGELNIFNKQQANHRNTQHPYRHQNKDEVFERGVINVFRGLSWNYKTNCPCKFGSKIIVNNLVRWDRWGFHLITGQQADRLADLERMLHLFSGKPIPDNRENITIHLDDHTQSVQGKEDYEDEMFSIRYFKKGSAHITFRKPELVDRLNEIIAKHYPGVLPS